LITQLPPKLSWLEAAITGGLGITSMKLEPLTWLESRQITVPEPLTANAKDLRWFGLLSLMASYNVANAVPAEKK
jgi:hypothetical protein